MEKEDGSAMTSGQLNKTMKLDGDLDTVCSNLTGEGSGELCDRGALGISLSTPILMMSTGVLGNLLALLVLLTADRQVRRTAFFPLLMGMACTDLVGQSSTGAIAVIVYANNLKWVGGTPLCLCHGFAMVFFAVITPLLVCSMSVERLLALRFSYFYQRCFTNRVAKGIIVGSLMFTFFFCTWPLMGFGSYERQFPGSWCFLNYHRESVNDMVYALVFSGLNIAIIAFIILCNATVVWTLLKMRRLRHQLNTSSSVERALDSNPRSRLRPRSALHLEMETQMVWFLLAITVVFSCLWLPINVHILINQITGETNYKQDLISVRLASINQIIDPWMYIILRKNTFFKFLRRIKQFITRGKSSCSNSVHSRSNNRHHQSLLNQVSRRQSGPSGVCHNVHNDGDNAVANEEQSAHQLLSHGVSRQPMLPPPSAGAPDDIELSLNGPLNVLGEAGYDFDLCFRQDVHEEGQREAMLKTRENYGCGPPNDHDERRSEAMLQTRENECGPLTFHEEKQSEVILQTRENDSGPLALHEERQSEAMLQTSENECGPLTFHEEKQSEMMLQTRENECGPLTFHEEKQSEVILQTRENNSGPLTFHEERQSEMMLQTRENECGPLTFRKESQSELMPQTRENECGALTFHKESQSEVMLQTRENECSPPTFHKESQSEVMLKTRENECGPLTFHEESQSELMPQNRENDCGPVKGDNVQVNAESFMSFSVDEHAEADRFLRKTEQVNLALGNQIIDSDESKNNILRRKIQNDRSHDCYLNYYASGSDRQHGKQQTSTGTLHTPANESGINKDCLSNVEGAPNAPTKWSYNPEG